MKGVILAGGKGTRLSPATLAMNKHMVPILNHPMILYPLETLKSLGVSDILVISGGNHIGAFAEFLGDGSLFGVRLTYKVQKNAGGIAEALLLAEDFAAGERIVAILGDNIFSPTCEFGLKDGSTKAQIWVKKVDDACRFGVLIGEKGDERIVEKPKVGLEGGYAVVGLYSYPPSVFDIIRKLTPSARGELEITDVNNVYLERNRCTVSALLPEEFWSDAGTPESLARTTAWATARLAGV